MSGKELLCGFKFLFVNFSVNVIYRNDTEFSDWFSLINFNKFLLSSQKNICPGTIHSQRCLHMGRTLCCYKPLCGV